jgi:hypothetical protein
VQVINIADKDLAAKAAASAPKDGPATPEPQ